MKVSITAARNLFQVLGYANAEKWGTDPKDTRLEDRINRLDVSVKDGEEPEQEEALTLYDEVCEALSKGEKIEVVGGEETNGEMMKEEKESATMTEEDEDNEEEESGESEDSDTSADDNGEEEEETPPPKKVKKKKEKVKTSPVKKDKDNGKGKKPKGEKPVKETPPKGKGKKPITKDEEEETPKKGRGRPPGSGKKSAPELVKKGKEVAKAAVKGKGKKEEEPVKRGRGRPPGVKNGEGQPKREKLPIGKWGFRVDTDMDKACKALSKKAKTIQELTAEAEEKHGLVINVFDGVLSTTGKHVTHRQIGGFYAGFNRLAKEGKIEKTGDGKYRLLK